MPNSSPPDHPHPVLAKPCCRGPLQKLGLLLSRLPDYASRLANIAVLLMVALVGVLVVSRHLLSVNLIAVQELVQYLHAMVFMLGAAYALKQNAHVRVDIFYRNFSTRTKTWINLLGGCFFLLPSMLYIGWISWDYVGRSWLMGETSSEPGGLPFVYLLKSLIILFAMLMLVQWLSSAIEQLRSLCKSQST